MREDDSLSAPQNAIVLVIDQLSAGQISAYGNTCFETENLNRMAAESLVFEQAISPTTDLADWYSWLIQDSLLSSMEQAGLGATLMTDELSLVEHPTFDGFDQVLPVDIVPSNRLAQSEAETELAQFFAAATQSIETAPEQSLNWLHCRGLSAAWDAPYHLRQAVADSEDPDPPEFFQPPMQRFSAEDDPDLLLGWQQACVAQVGMLDRFVGVMLDLLEQPRFSNTLFCLLSPRGYPLGEHGFVGEVDVDESTAELSASCFSESVHVPLMVRLPQSYADQADSVSSRLVRSHALVQPDCAMTLLQPFLTGDLQTLKSALEPFVYAFPRKPEEVVVIRNGREAAIQTHAWKLVVQLDSEACQLYAKPDDRWEVNDVSRRCPQVVESLLTLLRLKIESPSDPVQLEESLWTR